MSSNDSKNSEQEFEEESMKILTINIPMQYYKILKTLSNKDSQFRMFPSVSESIRQAIQKFLMETLHFAANLSSGEKTRFILESHQVTYYEPEEVQEVQAIQIEDRIHFADGTHVKVANKS